MRNRYIFIMLILLLAAGPIFGSGIQEPSSETNDSIIRIAAPRSAAALPALWMQDNSELPVSVEIYTSMEAMMALAQSDDIDLVMMPSNAAAILYNKGFEISMLNIFQWGGLFLSTTAPDCHCWEDLAGKELYVPSKGSVPDLTTQLFLEAHGLTMSEDLNIVYANHGEIAQLLSQGTIAHAVDVQPFVSKHQKSLEGYRIISTYADDWEDIGGDGSRMPGFCLVMKGSHPDAAAIDPGFREAVETIATDADTADELAVRYLKMKERMIADALDGFSFHYLTAREAKDDAETYFSLLKSLNPSVIGGSLPDEGFYYDAAAE